MPVLRVTDLSRAIDWYTGILGFELCWRSPNDGGGENCRLKAGQSSLLLSTGSHLKNEPGLSGTLYFETSGVRELYERIRDKVDIVWPLEQMDYGSVEFGIRDPDGYSLAFSESTENGTAN